MNARRVEDRPPLRTRREHRAHAAAPRRLLVAPGVRRRPLDRRSRRSLGRDALPAGAARDVSTTARRPHALPARRRARARRRDPAPAVGRAATSRSSRSTTWRTPSTVARVGPRCGAGAHDVAGVVLGCWASRRAVRPLADAARPPRRSPAAGSTPDSNATDDPDLARWPPSFNDMAAALQDRIERDARFASDVSHELRSPLMTLAASVEVLQARRDEMPERAACRARPAGGRRRPVPGLVEDLLEISRFDAGRSGSTSRTSGSPSSSCRR